MFRIGEFSKMSKTTIKALRYYDEIGLLKPEEADKFTNHRFYTSQQLFQLHRIQKLRQVGLSINEINLILTGHDFEPILQKRKMELVEENGYATADNPRESYIDGIWNKESEDEWLTEIQVPIIRK